MLAVTIIGGALPAADIIGTPLFDTAISAKAADGATVSYDETTHTLTLKAGNVDIDDVKIYQTDAQYIVAEPGAVLPSSCSRMFEGFSAVSIDLSNADTSSVTNMIRMFYSCSNLTTLNVSGFNTSNVTNMGDMFYGCNNLQKLDLSSFDTSKIDTMAYMFNSCGNLSTVIVSDKWSTASTPA